MFENFRNFICSMLHEIPSQNIILGVSETEVTIQLSDDNLQAVENTIIKLRSNIEYKVDGNHKLNPVTIQAPLIMGWRFDRKFSFITHCLHQIERNKIQIDREVIEACLLYFNKQMAKAD